MSKSKIGFVSLGCPKNRIDTEIMLSELTDAGYEIVSEDIDADIVIVNTCGFIESAKKEAIDNILDLAWLKENRDLKGIIAAGCLAERYRGQILEEMDEVDAVIGTGAIHDIVKAVEAVEAGERGFSLFAPMEELDLGGNRIVTTPQHTAYIKIAEGCDNRCAYCAIPNIRGGFRSRKIEDIVAEAGELESLGAKELILVAQDTTRFGEDIYGEYSLDRLLTELLLKTSVPWFRLLYCYPDKVTAGLIKVIAENDRVLNYIDLPIQHISDPVLKRMNRHGDSALIKKVISDLRESIPGIVIRTTLITGFPGETGEDFDALCEFVRERRFERLGVFPYSREEDTPAYDFPDQIDEQTKQDRADKIMEIQLGISESYNAAQVDKTIRVLCEGYDAVGEIYYGRSAADAPDIDGLVYFSSPVRVNEGDFVDVLIDSAVDYDLIGQKTSES